MSHAETKDFYNHSADQTENSGGYEYNRWFKDKISRQLYQMTAEEIERVCQETKFNDYLEVGCGPGVWSKFFLKNNSGKNFDLVDISGNMIKQAKDALKEYGNVRYFVSDFLDFVPDKKYDFFFSARAFEYIEDKLAAIKKIKELLMPCGSGFIITKTPKYLRSKIMGQKVSSLHRHQIDFSKLKKILREVGFGEIKCFAATAYFPFFKSTMANSFLSRFVKGRELNLFISLFTESYCVTFKKVV